MGNADQSNDPAPTPPGDDAGDAAQQRQSRDVTRRLVELFGDADQTNIRMQGSKFHGDSGKFSGVKDEETRAKLREAGLLLE